MQVFDKRNAKGSQQGDQGIIMKYLDSSYVYI